MNFDEISFDLYQILGVESETEKSKIKKAYKKLCIKYHPDKVSSEDENNMIEKINYAYSVLSKDGLRAKYDKFRKEKMESNTFIGLKTGFDENVDKIKDDLKKQGEDMVSQFGTEQKAWEEINKEMDKKHIKPDFKEIDKNELKNMNFEQLKNQYYADIKVEYNAEDQAEFAKILNQDASQMKEFDDSFYKLAGDNFMGNDDNFIDEFKEWNVDTIEGASDFKQFNNLYDNSGDNFSDNFNSIRPANVKFNFKASLDDEMKKREEEYRKIMENDEKRRKGEMTSSGKKEKKKRKEKFKKALEEEEDKLRQKINMEPKSAEDLMKQREEEYKKIMEGN